MANNAYDNEQTDKAILERLQREQSVIHQVAPRSQRVRRAEFRHTPMPSDPEPASTRPSTPEPLDLEALAGHHQAAAGFPGWCLCGEKEPCLTSALLAEVRRLQEELEARKRQNRELAVAGLAERQRAFDGEMACVEHERELAALRPIVAAVAVEAEERDYNHRGDPVVCRYCSPFQQHGGGCTIWCDEHWQHEPACPKLAARAWRDQQEQGQ